MKVNYIRYYLQLLNITMYLRSTTLYVALRKRIGILHNVL